MEQDNNIDKDLETNIQNSEEENLQKNENSLDNADLETESSLLSEDSEEQEVSKEELSEEESQTIENDENEDLASEVQEITAENISQENNEILNDEFSQNDGNQPDEMITVRPVKFQQFEITEPNRTIKKNLDILQDISIHISVELGKTKFNIKEVMDITEGTIVELDKIAGEQVEIYANNKLIARGEVIVIEDKFGVRITGTSLPKKSVTI